MHLSQCKSTVIKVLKMAAVLKGLRDTHRSTGYAVSGLLNHANSILVSEKNAIDKV